MEITEMTLTDLEQMKNTLYSDFDNFWSYNVLKQELENENTTYVIAKENSDVVGFAGISICLDEATLNNIVVKRTDMKLTNVSSASWKATLERLLD